MSVQLLREEVKAKSRVVDLIREDEEKENEGPDPFGSPFELASAQWSEERLGKWMGSGYGEESGVTRGIDQPSGPNRPNYPKYV